MIDRSDKIKGREYEISSPNHFVLRGHYYCVWVYRKSSTYAVYHGPTDRNGEANPEGSDFEVASKSEAHELAIALYYALNP